jgi:hypothetical protein
MSQSYVASSPSGTTYRDVRQGNCTSRHVHLHHGIADDGSVVALLSERLDKNSRTRKETAQELSGDGFFLDFALAVARRSLMT